MAEEVVGTNTNVDGASNNNEPGVVDDGTPYKQSTNTTSKEEFIEEGTEASTTNQKPRDENNNEEGTSPSSSPEKAVIVIGEAMYLQASGDSDVISLNVYTKEAMMNCLPDSSIPDNSLDEIHLIIKTNKIEPLYNPNAIPGLVKKLKSPPTPTYTNEEEEEENERAGEGGTLTIHILGEEGYELMQEDDVETLVSSLVLGGGDDGDSNLKILQLKLDPSDEDGSRNIVARKI